MNNKYKLIILFIVAYLAASGSLLRSPDMSAVAFFLGFPAALIYIIPSIIARQKRKFSAVFWLNLLLGVTILGWVVALIVALIPEKEVERVLL